MKIDFDELASHILFSSITEKSMLIKFKLEYRKNKTVKDLKNAIKKAMKKGNGKTESELSFLSLYISQVFKQNAIVDNKS